MGWCGAWQAIFSFAEAGYTPTFNGLGQGRYAFGIWHMDAPSKFQLPEDYGVTFIVDQNLTDTLDARRPHVHDFDAKLVKLGFRPATPEQSRIVREAIARTAAKISV